MGTSKFYLAVGFITLMAAPLVFTKNNTNTSTSTFTVGSTNPTKFQPPTSTITTVNSMHVTNDSCKTFPTTRGNLIGLLDNKFTFIGSFGLLLCLVISNTVLICCICSLRRRVSSWTINRIGNLMDVTEDRYVVRDAGLPVDQAVELSTIYTMPDKTKQERNTEETQKAEGTATTSEVEPANGDAQSPEQAESLLPEPPADAAEPVDDVTDVLLVV